MDQNDNVLPIPLAAVAPDQAAAAPPPPPLPPVSTSTSQPFIEPTFFRLRLCGLCLFTCLSLTFLSILGLTIPATIGRYLLSFITGSARLHELYTILTGLYILWLISRIIFFVRSLLPFDVNNMLTRLKSYSILCIRVLLCTFCVIGYVPFMIGLASELGKIKLGYFRLKAKSCCLLLSSVNYSIEYIYRTNRGINTITCLDYWFAEYENCHR